MSTAYAEATTTSTPPQRHRLGHGSSSPLPDWDQLKCRKELLSVASRTAVALCNPPDLERDPFSLIPLILGRIKDGYVTNIDRKSDKDLHIIELLLPVKWNELKKSGPYTADDIQKHRSTLIELPSDLTQEAARYKNGETIQDFEKFIHVFTIWMISSLKSGIDCSNNIFIAEHRHLLRPQTIVPNHKLEVRQDERAREDIGSLEHRSSSAFMTAGIGLINLCIAAGVPKYHKVRERSAFLREIHRYQGELTQQGLAGFLSEYVKGLKRYNDKAPEDRRSFERNLYGEESLIYDVAVRHKPTALSDTDLELVDLQTITANTRPSPAQRKVVLKFQRKILDDKHKGPIIILSSTETAAAICHQLIGDKAKDLEILPGALVTSAVHGEKRESLFRDLAEGNLSYLSLTPIADVPCEMLNRESPVLVLVTGQRRRKLSNYPVIQNLLEAGIPVTVAAYSTKTSRDRAARKRYSQSNRVRKPVFESGPVTTLRQLEYFDHVINQTKGELVQGQVTVLMAMFRSFEGLRTKIAQTGRLTEKDAETFEVQILQLMDDAHETITTKYQKSSRQKFSKLERDLTYLLKQELGAARRLYLEEKGITEDIATCEMKFALFFSRLIKWVKESNDKESVRMYARAALNAIEGDMADMNNEISGERTAATAYFDAPRLRPYMIKHLRGVREKGGQFSINMPAVDSAIASLN